jgi:AraC-like DNA-binding protein
MRGRELTKGELIMTAWQAIARLPTGGCEMPARSVPDRGVEYRLISTADVPEREQFAFWRDGFMAPTFGVRSELLVGSDRGFHGQAEGWIAACLRYFRYSSDNLMISRSPRELAGCRSEGFSIYRESASGAWLTTAGGEFVTAAGDFIISNSEEFLFTEKWAVPAARFQPPEVRSHLDVCVDIWRLPKALLMPHLPAPVGPFLKHLKGAGIAAVLAAYLEALRRELPVMAPPLLDAVADNLARLTAIAVGAPQDVHQGAVRTAFLERVKMHIACHLADPELGPASVAAALGVSERKLHLAFEPTGTSFAEFVRRRRLAECKAALASPVATDRSVADIAFGWGFQSLATFYRAFQREYGIAPREVREAAPRARI